MSLKVLQDLDFGSAARILNLLDPSAAQHPATKAYVDAAVEGLAWKDSCRVSTQGNLNLASPGATIDGITMVSGDRFLARQQSTASQNGIYVWNGAATPATRAADASTFPELEEAVVSIEEGTDADTTWRQTEVNGTIDSSTVTFGSFGTSAPSASETTAGIAELATQAETDTGTDDTRIVTPLKLKTASFISKHFKQNIGDGAATQYTVTHNLATRDVQVQVVRVASPYDSVLADIERDTANSVVVRFATAPSSNQFRVLISTVP